MSSSDLTSQCHEMTLDWSVSRWNALCSLLPQFVWCTDILLLSHVLQHEIFIASEVIWPYGGMQLPAIWHSHCSATSAGSYVYSERIVRAWKLEQSAKWYDFSSLCHSNVTLRDLTGCVYACSELRLLYHYHHHHHHNHHYYAYIFWYCSEISMTTATFIPWWKCGGRRPHFPVVKPRWTALKRNLLLYRSCYDKLYGGMRMSFVSRLCNAGSRGRRTASLCRPHGSSRLPESDENQHVLVGEDTQAEFSTQEISHQASPRRLR